MKGSIKTLVPGKGFGFILGDDQVEYFFHRTGVGRAADFEALQEGDGVQFTVEENRGKGPRATDVRKD